MDVLNVLSLSGTGGKKTAFLRNLTLPESRFTSHVLLTEYHADPYYRQFLDESQIALPWKYLGPLKIPSFLRNPILDLRLKYQFPDIDCILVFDSLNKRRRPLRSHLLNKVDAPTIYADRGDTLELSKDQEDLIQGYDHYVGVATSAKVNLEKRYGIPSDKISVVHNSIPEQHFEKINAIRNQNTPDDLLNHPDKFNLVYVGRLGVRKGTNILIRAMRDLDEDIHLNLVGDYSNDRDMIRLAEELNVDDQVTFYGNMDEPTGFYVFSDLFVMPTLSEGLPNVLLEAGAAKLPVVTTKVDGTADLVEHNKHGHLIETKQPLSKYEDDFDDLESQFDREVVVDPDTREYMESKFPDPEDFVESIQWFFDNPEKRQEMGEDFRDHIKTEFNSKKIAEEYAQIFESLSS